MRAVALLVIVAACASHAGTAPVDEPHPATQVSVPPAPAPALSEAAVRAKSHDFFDALDRFDNAAFDSFVGEAFIMFIGGRYLDAAWLRKQSQGLLDRHAPVRSRTWSDERVFVGPASAAFIGHNVQHVPGEAGEPGHDREGYSSVVWVRDGQQWKAAYATWARAGIDAEKEKWNEAFRLGTNFRKEPNQLLVDTLKGKKPGAALDLDMGQGRNALYIASQGWKVTGVDISDEGLKIARDEAAKRKLKIEVVQVDVDTWDLGKDRWDLVTMLYAGDDAKLVERIKPSLKKGGLFVLEHFHADSDAAKMGAGGWATGALAKLFGDGFEIVRDDVVDDISDWGLTQRKLVRFVARKK